MTLRITNHHGSMCDGRTHGRTHGRTDGHNRFETLHLIIPPRSGGNKQFELMLIVRNKNSEFRIYWPRGTLGALPDDAEQNMRLSYLEKQVDKLEEEIEELDK